MKIPREQYDDYMKRSGDDQFFADNLTVNDHGFCSYKVSNGILVGFTGYGDGEYWDKFLQEKAKENDCNKYMITTRRNPKVFERKYGFKIAGYILEKEVN